MKILYAIQGTGNGHLSRARGLIPALQEKAELDLLVSGIQTDVHLPYPVKYRFKGLSFIFGKNGGVDIVQTLLKASIFELLRDIKRLPVESYDLVISDFEPISAWACRLNHKACIGLSHQSAVLHPSAPQPEKKDILGKWVLRHYAPVKRYYGFHFEKYDYNIFTPVIRQRIRNAPIEHKNHITVYLPSYDDVKLEEWFKSIPVIDWHIFSKHTRSERASGNVRVFPIDNDAFIESMTSGQGVLCGAGFETPAEAIFLGKKLLVVPMKNQYEQHCNAAALGKIGINVLPTLNKNQLPAIRKWVQSGKAIQVPYPDQTEEIMQALFQEGNN